MLLRPEMKNRLWLNNLQNIITIRPIKSSSFSSYQSFAQDAALTRLAKPIETSIARRVVDLTKLTTIAAAKRKTIHTVVSPKDESL